jgi:alkylation response protein AidB-like acyl-CoA dehydrogenase
MNYCSDNPDLLFHFERGLDLERSVPLWEPGFADPDGPRSAAEAREVYLASLRELGGYVAREVAPRAAEIDEQGVAFAGGQVRQPEALLRNIAGLKALGVMAPSLPRALGGSNFPFSVSAACLELIARACTNTMVLYAFHQSPALMIQRFGTGEQVARWVPALAAGDVSGAVSMTEPEAGSDLGRISTAAVPDGPHWRLSGRKQFVTNGCGECCLVLARGEPGSQGLRGLSLFLVARREDGRDNYTLARPEKKFTLRGSATCELHFDGARAELLGQAGQGFRHMLSFMNEARVAVGFQALGLCQAALERAGAYAERRVQLGRPIARHALIADLLWDLRAEVAALRALAYACTALQDRVTGLERAGAGAASPEIMRVRAELRELTPLVKWLGAERALWAARSAVQVHGGYGVVQEYGVERLYRDALILPIYEGTSQIQALMSLKDRLRAVLARPQRLLFGTLRVQAGEGEAGDALREMAGEYDRALRRLVARGVGATGLLAAWRGRREAASAARLDAALLQAERLVEMLALTRAGEALLRSSRDSVERRRLAERFLHRSLPRVRYLADVVRQDDRSALPEAADA